MPADRESRGLMPLWGEAVAFVMAVAAVGVTLWKTTRSSAVLPSYTQGPSRTSTMTWLAQHVRRRGRSRAPWPREVLPIYSVATAQETAADVGPRRKGIRS